LGSGSSVPLSSTVNICISDNLPCSQHVKGVGFGSCIKNLARWGTVRICSRFSDVHVSLLEYSIRNKIRGDYEVAIGEVLESQK